MKKIILFLILFCAVAYSQDNRPDRLIRQSEFVIDTTSQRAFSDLKYATKDTLENYSQTDAMMDSILAYRDSTITYYSVDDSAGLEAYVDSVVAFYDLLGLQRNIPDKEYRVRTEGYGGGVATTNTITVPSGQTGEFSVFYLESNWNDDFFTDFNGKQVIGYWVFRTTNGDEITDWDAFLTGIDIDPSQRLTVFQDIINDVIICYDTFTVDNTWDRDSTGMYLQIRNDVGIGSQFTITYLAQYFNPLEDNAGMIAEGEENYKTKYQIMTEIQDYDFADIVHLNTDPDTTIITVARYGTAGVDADYVGNNAIQEAIDDITDNNRYNTYVIEIGEGVYEALDSTDLTVTDVWNIRNFVEGKDYVSLKGANRDKTIISLNLPDDYDPAFTYDRAQTIRWDCAYTTLENITVIAKNARYAIHREGSTTGNTDETTIIKNCSFIHRGNTGEAEADWGAYYPFGLGISQGERLFVSDSYFEGYNHPAIYLHANPGADEGIYYEFDNCIFKGGTIAAYSWATNQNDRLVIKGSTFLDRTTIDYGSLPEQQEPDADNSEIMIDIDDSPLVISHNSLLGRALKITSNLTDTNSTVRFVETSTAFMSIIGDTTEILTETIYNDSTVYGYRFKNGGGGLQGYAISGIDIDSTQATKPLGVRLGDCSSVNKVLGIVINDTTYNVTFNANYTSVGTYTILAMINSAISGHGVATLYKAGQDYYPKFRGNQVLTNADTTAIYQGMGIVFDDSRTMRKAKNTDYYIDGICIDDVAPDGFGRVITEGDIFTQYSDKRFDVLEVSTATRTAGTGLGISTTQDGYFDVNATPSVLRAFNTDMLRFATTGATFSGDVSIPDSVVYASELTAGLAPKLNATDTLSLSNRINLKLTATDTASLSNRINLKLNATDTTSLSNRINLKLNISDTTAFRTFSDLKYLEPSDTTSLLATQYDLTQIETSAGTDSSTVIELVHSVIDSLDISDGYYVGKVEQFSEGGIPMVINPEDSGDVLIMIVSAQIPTDWNEHTHYLYYDGSPLLNAGGIIPSNNEYVTYSYHITVDDTDDVDFGIYDDDIAAWGLSQNATVITLKRNALQSVGFDTLSYSVNIPDTVIAGDNAIWKIPNNITITEISATTNTGTVTFNIEERGETTPNTAGTDVMGSDLVADTNQEETSTFSNAAIAKYNRLVLVVTSITGDPTLFEVTIFYIKTD